MTTLIVHFDADSPPGILPDLLPVLKPARICHPLDGDLPTLEGYDNVVLLGGDLSADDDLQALHRLKAALARRHAAGGRTLGICLGAQILAVVLGGGVTRLPQEELGVLPVALTDAGRDDPLFRNIPAEAHWVQSHGDAIRLPPSAVRLAGSAACPVQAFRSGRSVGVQFHPEAASPTLRNWARRSAPDERERVERDIADRMDDAVANGVRLLRNWLQGDH